jgi:methylmalonyl-CoA mutase cobalamin-binding subunit
MRTLLCAAAVTALAALAPLQAQSHNAKLVTHQVFIAVTDQSGAPVLDLGPGDFEVNEAGVKRVVVRAGLSKDPMRVAMLIDTGDDMSATLTNLRAGLIGFIDTLPAEHEVLLASTGRQFRVRVQPTTDRKKLKDAASSLFGDGGGTVLMDGLLEADSRFLRKAENRWPVFVIVTSDGTEISAGAHEKEFNQWVVALAQRGVSVHAFVFKTGKGSGIPEMIAQNATHNTGGRYDMMNTTTSLPEKMKMLAAQLAADAQKISTWYTVEFQTESAELKPIDVAVPRNGVKLQMSYRRGGQ